jgi:two-component system cell cycle response regulator
MRILIVEDDPVLSFMLEQLARKAGLESIAVDVSHSEVVRILREHDPPDMVIVDHAPPARDALALCEAIRAAETDRRCHAIVIVPADEGLDFRQITESGFDDVVVKPFLAGEVEARLCVAGRLLDLQLVAAAADSARSAQATRDDLTGTLNRGAVIEVVRQEQARADRDGTTLVAMMFEVDNLKGVNDWHGYDVGDGVLVEVTARLKRGLRVYDALGRWDGGAFLAVLPRCALTSATLVAERARDSIATTPVDTHGRLISVTVSLGLAQGGGIVGDRSDRLVAAAEDAMRRARAAGGNRVVVSDPPTRPVDAA